MRDERETRSNIRTDRTNLVLHEISEEEEVISLKLNDTMSEFLYEVSSKRIRHLALLSAIIHLLLGMSCIIIIMMYNSIFWIYYLLASAPNYAVSVVLLHAIKHKNQRRVRLWIIYNVLQIIFCVLLFAFTCYQYYSVENMSNGNQLRTTDTKYLTDKARVHKIKTGALLDAATAMTFVLLMSTCCNMVIHYHEEMKMGRKSSGGKYVTPQEQKKEVML